MRNLIVLTLLPLLMLSACRTRSSIMPMTTTCIPGPVTRDTVATGKSIEYTGVNLVLSGGTTELAQLYRFDGFRYPEHNPTAPPLSDYKVLLGSRGAQARAHIHHSEESLVVEEGVVAAIGIAPIIYVKMVRLGSESSTLAAETCPEGDYLYFVKGHGTSPVAKVAIEGSTNPPVILTPGQFVLVTNPATAPVIGPPQSITGDEHATEFIKYMSKRAAAAGVPFDHAGGWGSSGGAASMNSELKTTSASIFAGAGTK